MDGSRKEHLSTAERIPPELSNCNEGEDTWSEHSDPWELINEGLPSPSDPPASPKSAKGSKHSRVMSPGESSVSSTVHYSGRSYSVIEDAQSDAETHLTDDLLRRGELDLDLGTLLLEGSPEAETEGGSCCPSGGPLATGLGTTEKGLIAGSECSTPKGDKPAGQQGLGSRIFTAIAVKLRALAAKVRAYVVHRQPAVYHLAEFVLSRVREIIQQVCWAPGVPGIKSMRLSAGGATFAAKDLSIALMRGVQGTVTRVQRNNLCAKLVAKGQACTLDFDWSRVLLMLGCAGLAGLLWRSNQANAHLSARLVHREAELAELVARIVALQRNISSQRIPIVRHTICNAAAGWPIVLQAI